MTAITYRKSLYDRVIKYRIEAECREPLHIGGGMGDRGEILVHPVSGRPFLQATGIAGAFREYYSYDPKLQKELFGIQENDDIACSKVRFTDGDFEHAAVYTELRPRVRIDRKTGTCQTNRINGGTADSGQKFETESVSADSVFRFVIYLFEKETDYQDQIERALTALHNGNIQFGGQKSNGCGYVGLRSVQKSVYDMRNAEDRNLWLVETKPEEEIVSRLTENDRTVDGRLHFVLDAMTEGSILVKSVHVREYDENAPDAENIRNHRKEYILPASSVKGVVRSRIEKICALKGMAADTVDKVFGKSGGKDSDDAGLGCVRFYDCVIGEIESNDRMLPQSRIHIDKFTGGVMYQGLFSEKAAAGNLKIRVDITGDGDDRAKALLLLALRDIGAGVTPLGSGSSIGRGFLRGSTLLISSGQAETARIDFGNGTISGEEPVINSWLAALR